VVAEVAVVLGKQAVNPVGALLGIESGEQRVVQVVARDPEPRAPDQLLPAAPCEVVLEVEIEGVAALVVGSRDVARGMVQPRPYLYMTAAGGVAVPGPQQVEAAGIHLPGPVGPGKGAEGEVGPQQGVQLTVVQVPLHRQPLGGAAFEV